MSFPLARAKRVIWVFQFGVPRFSLSRKGNNIDISIGLDVSLASTAVCVLSSHSKVVKEITALSEPGDLERVLRSLLGTAVAVGQEAGPLSQWLYRHLTEAGFDTVLMETRQVKAALKAMPIKTDRRDAEGIARPTCRSHLQSSYWCRVSTR